jgi:ring-1,2-phenylacetyl-CoA epoxidase subunit PaaB
MPADAGDETAFEVFVRTSPDRPLTHVGSVRGTDPVLAWQAARDVYTRREVTVDLWVVPRWSITRSTADDAQVLTASERRPYRQPGYPSGHRRRIRAGAETKEATS